MKNFAENKYFTFSLGLILGVLLTVFVFYSFRDIVKNELEKMGISFSHEPKEGEIIGDQVKIVEAPKKIKRKVGDGQNAEHDSISVDSLTYRNADTLIASDMTTISSYNNYSDGIVAKDELLHSKTIVPTGIRNKYFCEPNDDLDSTLVNNPSKKQEGLNVEFWRSPVNFKGYKLGRKKLVLYGVYAYDQVSLVYGANNQIVMKYNGREYQLKCAEDFIPTIFVN